MFVFVVCFLLTMYYKMVRKSIINVINCSFFEVCLIRFENAIRSEFGFLRKYPNGLIQPACVSLDSLFENTIGSKFAVSKPLRRFKKLNFKL